jgi:hypothetical protein
MLSGWLLGLLLVQVKTFPMIEENYVFTFSLHQICKKSSLCEKNGLVAQY